MPARKYLSVVASLALIAMSVGLLATTFHGHALGSSGEDRDCGVCKWSQAVGAAPLPQGISLQPTLPEVALVAPARPDVPAGPAVTGSASRAPPAC